MRYYLVAPKDANNEGSGEGEGDDDAGRTGGEDIFENSLFMKGRRNYGGEDRNPELYKDQALYEEIDQLYGVNSFHYAEIAKS